MTVQNRNNIQKTISIPSQYDSSARQRIGELMVEQIRRRTANGVSANGTAFRYAPGSSHAGDNLKDSGDMLTELGIISTSSGAITIGYANIDTIEANQAEGNTLGTYGKSNPNPAVAKPFIGISNDELDLILARYDQEVSSGESLVNNFINSILSNQGL